MIVPDHIGIILCYLKKKNLLPLNQRAKEKVVRLCSVCLRISEWFSKIYQNIFFFFFVIDYTLFLHQSSKKMRVNINGYYNM